MSEAFQHPPVSRDITRLRELLAVEPLEPLTEEEKAAVLSALETSHWLSARTGTGIRQLGTSLQTDIEQKLLYWRTRIGLPTSSRGAALEDLIEEKIAEGCDPVRMLDLGTFNASFPSVLKERFGDMIDTWGISLANNQKHEIDHFLIGAFEYLPAHLANRFDIISSSAALSNSVLPHRSLRAICAALTRGGHAILNNILPTPRESLEGNSLLKKVLRYEIPEVIPAHVIPVLQECFSIGWLTGRYPNPMRDSFMARFNGHEVSSWLSYLDQHLLRSPELPVMQIQMGYLLCEAVAEIRSRGQHWVEIHDATIFGPEEIHIYPTGNSAPALFDRAPKQRLMMGAYSIP